MEWCLPALIWNKWPQATLFLVSSQGMVREKDSQERREKKGSESIVRDIFHFQRHFLFFSPSFHQSLCHSLTPAHTISNDWPALFTALQTPLYLSVEYFPLSSLLLFLSFIISVSVALFCFIFLPFQPSYVLQHVALSSPFLHISSLHDLKSYRLCMLIGS